MEINNQTEGLVLDIFTSTSFGPYPYFILTNTNGVILAQEQIYYFGLSETSTHNLQLLTDPSSWDSNLILELYEGMGDNLECTFDISVGCTNYLATNYIPNANLDDGSCNSARRDALGFELLESQITFTESQFGDTYALNIPMENNSSKVIQSMNEIPLGHKIAMIDLKEGDTILKYGHDIGKVVKSIKKGEHVHVHNVKTKKW